jgi:ATP/maltotriose-dependent transcriptional regulator MalT
MAVIVLGNCWRTHLRRKLSMSHRATPTVSWSAVSQVYELSEGKRDAPPHEVHEGPAWFAWLAERSSFAFHGQAGSYTARLEAVQRGERYWYAYLRLGQKLRKKYLGKPEEALQLLDGLRAHARAQGRLSSELEILVLCALAEDAQGQTRQAVQHLEQALVLAEPQGYVRLFVDEGVPLASLLRLVLSRWRGKPGARYVRRLLSILQAAHPEQAEPLPSLLVPLSGRERTILRALAAGRSTTEMAAELVVSANTIKTQVSSLYHKLNVHSREEALAAATRLHLL